MTGPLWYWSKGYLTDRLHFIQYKGATSSYLPVVSGVPQGSALGPLLFLNDIPTAISYSTIYLFADDTKVVKSLTSNNNSLQLQNDLDSLNGWSKDTTK